MISQTGVFFVLGLHRARTNEKPACFERVFHWLRKRLSSSLFGRLLFGRLFCSLSFFHWHGFLFHHLSFFSF